MTPIEQAYLDRFIYRQTIITDLVIMGANPEFFLHHKPTTEQLEGLLAGLIKIKLEMSQHET